MAFMKEAIKLIETASDGVEIGCATKMPFAKKAGDVSGIYQHISQSLFAHRQTGIRILVVPAGWIEFITKTCLVAPSE